MLGSSELARLAAAVRQRRFHLCPWSWTCLWGQSPAQMVTEPPSGWLVHPGHGEGVLRVPWTESYLEKERMPSANHPPPHEIEP